MLGRLVGVFLILAGSSCSDEEHGESPPEAPNQEVANQTDESGHQSETSTSADAPPALRVVHTEFQSTDAKATSEFLSAMFGVSLEESSTPAGPLYTFAAEDGTGFATRNAAVHEDGPGTTVYFETTDLAASLSKAERHGARVIVPKMTFAGRGYIAWVEVPGGVRLAFLERDPDVTTTGETPAPSTEE